jgi:hypothetical protein
MSSNANRIKDVVITTLKHDVFWGGEFGWINDFSMAKKYSSYSKAQLAIKKAESLTNDKVVMSTLREIGLNEELF